MCCCVHWALSLERHQRPTDFDPGGVCGGPLAAPPSTSARVQSRFEVVELGDDMYSNCHRCNWNLQGHNASFNSETDLKIIARTQKKWKNRQRSSLTQLGVWPLEGVCHAPHSQPSSNEEENSERSGEVSPYLMVACVQVPVRTFPERLPTACLYLIRLLFIPLCVLVYVYALSFVPRTPPKDHRFRPRGRLWRPLIRTSIHLCSRSKPFWVRGAWWRYVL